MAKGEIVFDSAAISDSEAVRGERAARTLVARLRRPEVGRGTAATADQCRAQVDYGGAIYMEEGIITFRGNSTISRTKAVRFAGATHTCALVRS
jgi:hypothetical protein